MAFDSNATGDAPDPRKIFDTALEHHRAGRRDKARALYSVVLNLAPRNPDALNMIGILAAEDGQFPQARKLIGEAIAAQPDNVEFRFNLAHTLHLAKDAGARDAYGAVLKLDPAHLPSLINLGNLELTEDRLEAAIGCFDRAARAEPRAAAAHLGLGLALQRRHETEAARLALERALALEPRNLEAMTNLAGVLMDLGRCAEAIPYLRQVHAARPDNPDLKVNLGVALLEAGDTAAALDTLRAAHALDRDHSRAIAMLGLLLAASGETDEAAAIFDYDTLLRSRRLTQAPGFANLAAFNRALAARALGHPTLLDARPGKTTRVGSQTGDLADDDDPAIQTLLATIEAQAEAYFDALPAEHPYAPRRPARWRLTLWATVLRHGGYQDPHLHPAGRLSGVYYARVPATKTPGPDADQGAILFGKAPTRFGEIALPERLIHPAEGQLLFFPSYFWHRTLPFESEPERISFAFDLLPE